MVHGDFEWGFIVDYHYFDVCTCALCGLLLSACPRSAYEGDPRSNANSCAISFTIAIFQDSLHQIYDALSVFPDPITILTESRSNPR